MAFPRMVFAKALVCATLALQGVLTDRFIFGAGLLAESAFAVTPKPLTENAKGESKAKTSTNNRLALHWRIELTVNPR